MLVQGKGGKLMPGYRIAHKVHVLDVPDMEAGDWAPKRRYVTEVWRQEWRSPGRDQLTCLPLPEQWLDEEDTERGFGATLEDALADLLRREHDADRARYQPPACKLREES